MNCDQVFGALTRGPFPTGNDALDERVERHLERCGSCRRLAAALQPAVELFEEAVSPEESCRLPAYWGELFNQSESAPATRMQSPLTLRRVRADAAANDQANWRWEHTWRIAAALLLGMAMGGVIRATLQEDEPPTSTRPLAAVAGSSSRDGQPTSRFAAFDTLRMTAACGPLAMVFAPPEPPAADSAAWDAGIASPSQPAVSASSADPAGEPALAGWNEMARQKCCTECHHAGGDAPVATQARTQLASSCALCHDDTAAAWLTVPLGGE